MSRVLRVLKSLVSVIIGSLLVLSMQSSLAQDTNNTDESRQSQSERNRDAPKLTPARLGAIKARAANGVNASKKKKEIRTRMTPSESVRQNTIRVEALIDKKLKGRWLADIQARKNDKSFLGVIGSVNLNDGVQISLERHNVITPKGVLPLMLTRIGNQYVYDGDIIVPPMAIVGIGFPSAEDIPDNVTFAAGIPGTFGEGGLWDDGILPFETADDFCCDAELVDAIADYEARTVFRFVPRDGHETYVHFVNAFLTTSRTSLGKQPGENTVFIKAGSSTANIQHEIGHELSLIHEHLRSDRDKHIARNPNCNAGNIFQAIYEGWIDITNVSFTNDAAELLTDYDFDSMMHYSFLLDNTGDGTADCSTWVRIESCDNRDPASPSCRSRFRSTTPTTQDIEGLHKLYSTVPGANMFLENPDQVRVFTGDNIRHRGKRVDHCLHGLPFGSNGCNATSRDLAADAFCEAKGFTDGFNVQHEGMWGSHSGFHATDGWIDVWGADVISSITCQNLTDTAELVAAGTLEEVTFSDGEVRIGGRPIDRCVFGSNVSGNRCSEANQRLIADNFCEEKDFDESSAFESGWGPNPFMTGYHPDTDDFRDVAGIDYFTEITCVK